MDKLNIKFEYCYGIRKLEKEFIFSNRTFAIYAPNGSMKTSFARTFKDLIDGRETKDLVFPERQTIRQIKDESNLDLTLEQVFVVDPYNPDFISTKESTLVIKKELKEKYEEIYNELDKEKKSFITKLKSVSQSTDCEEELLLTFATDEKDTFFDIIQRAAQLFDGTQIVYDFKYNDVFDKKGNVKKFLDKHKNALNDYLEKYNSLISGSEFFKKSSNTFGTYQAGEILKSVEDNSFFDAGHSINLSNNTKIVSAEDLKKTVEGEVNKIISDEKLKKIFDTIDKAIGANVELRALKRVIEKDNSLLIELNDYENFKKKVWLGFLAEMQIDVKALIEFYTSKRKDLVEILKQANDASTEWEESVKEFNDRFSSLPFKIKIKNKEDAVLKTNAPVSEFIFNDREQKCIGKEDLLRVLSQGERRALYLLNIIFEIRARKKAQQKTLLIIDDIADSFDYKNKYAIIEYLKDISEDDNFFQIILTHNFDFFRTILSRGIVPYNQCLVSVKNDLGVKLEQASYVKNPFINDWKKCLNDNKKLVACIPFVRNIIEYTKGNSDEDYLLLTSLLHFKDRTELITIRELKEVFNRIITDISFPSEIDENKNILDIIFESSEECLTATEGMNLENKIVLSIAIRLKAEQFMKSRITDKDFLGSLDGNINQGWSLLKKFQEEFNNEKHNIDILKKVNLITPENIHVNSFMYEPILDMGDNELRNLYKAVKERLAVPVGNLDFARTNM